MSQLRLLILSIVFIGTSSTYSQTSTLQLNEIMAGNDFIGHQPFGFVWGLESENIYFRWNPDQKEVAPHWKYSIETKELTELTSIKSYQGSLNGHIERGPTNYFKRGNCIYKWEDKKRHLLYSSSESFELIDEQNGHLLIRQNNQLYSLALNESQFTQLTNFDKGTPPTSPPETKSYLEQQQLELFQTERSKAKRKTALKNFDDINADNEKVLKPFYLEDKNLGAINLSLQTKSFLFSVDEYPTNTSTNYPAFVTSNGYTESKNARAKVGSKNPTHSLFLTNTVIDTTWKIDFSNLTGINDRPEYLNLYPEKDKEVYTKNLIYHLHQFNKSGDKALIEIKSYDNKDRWIGYVKTENGQFVELNHQHDEAWIGGPGISGWNMVPGNIGWIDSETFFYQSEKTGFSHLYMMNINNPTKEKALTSGKYEVHEAYLNSSKDIFYLSTNETHPGNRSFYQLDLKTKKQTPILIEDGNHEVMVSPNEKWLLVNYSNKNTPWDLYIAPNTKSSSKTQITNSPSSKFKSYAWRSPEVITFKASDNEDIHARIFKPSQESKNGAAVLFVHGAGYLQNAHNWWSAYYREYMFNNLLCDLGYTVLDIDYRASKGYGRDFRTAIYRWMGGKDLSDHIDGRDYLINEHDIDPERIGLYGGSYGGFITLMALLTEPGKFKCGAAIRSVTDWAHYNHAYTSNILNTPETDPEAFKKSSPIYFAENLEDKLLMLHGIVDNNVQYQDVARLSQRFIELGKTNWNLVGYPIEPHGFKETTSWTDEYGRILQLFNQELLSD